MTNLQSPTHFTDLASELDSIYNTYVDNNSTGTLDSDKDRAPVPHIYEYHLRKKALSEAGSSSAAANAGSSSRDSSMSAGSSSFDFGAEANASLQVLVGNESSANSLSPSRSYLSSGSALDLPGSTGLGTVPALNRLVEDDELLDVDDSDDAVDSDGVRLSSAAAANRSKWNEQGAAVATTDDGSRVVRRGVKDFKFGRTLGEGAYSTVVLAKDKHTHINYAVKILNKRHITKEKKVRYVNIEKNALNRLANRMGIISLYFTFQDEESLYFVLSYASRGELLTLLKKYGSLNEDCVRHYGAQILDAIKFMHDNGVVHRDIKPENILLDEKLRIQITDFGTARLLEKRSKDEGAPEEYPFDVRAKSFVGTAEYVSPELLDSKYCGKPGDVWAFGCIIYQMIAGKPPFQAPNEYLTFQKITKLQYAFSAGFPTVVRDLIKQILVLQPSKRLKIVGIENHYFFQPIDFSDFHQIWDTKPPEFGPYKMSAKSMMKMPAEHSKSRSATPTPHHSAPTSAKARPPNKKSASAPGTATSSASPRAPASAPDANGKLSAASVAAFVLKNAHEDDHDAKVVAATPAKASSRSATTTTTNSADYIPGTNILRPTINSRSISRNTVAKKKKAGSPGNSVSSSLTKSKIMEVPSMTSLDIAWCSYFNHPDERIIRIGPVHVHREPTESFEKKNKGMLYNAPLGLTGKLQAISSASSNYSGRNSSTLLSQVVNGTTSGLRGPLVSNEEKVVSEEDAILDHYKAEPVSVASSPSNSASSSSTKHRSILSKFRLSSGSGSSAEKETAPEESVTKHPLDKAITCTMLVTSHGRAVLLSRSPDTDTYKLIAEVNLSYPFIQFKELVGSSSKFQKMLPTTGIFAVVSTQTTFVFEVEKYEVGLWTDSLARAKLNQLEREKFEREGGDLSRASSELSLESESIKEKESKIDRSASSNRPSTPKMRQESSMGSAPPPKVSSPSHVGSPQTGRPSQSMMAAKFKYSSTRRKAPPSSVSPPPSNTPSSPKILSSTGLAGGSDAASNGTLHAAILAVTHGQQTASTNNRRSSFTKRDGELPLVRSSATGLTNGGSITSKNSKFLARSQRYK